MSVDYWKESDLDSMVAVLESGSRPKGGASTETGEIPSLGGENIIRNGGVTLEYVKMVPLSFYERMTKGHLLNGDVLINKDGAQTGKVGIYRDCGNIKASINEHLFLMRAKEDILIQEYLYYILLSESGQKQIAGQISGSAQPGLKSNFLRGVVTEIPPVPEQTKIAEILSTIDRAIEQTEALIAKQQRLKTGLMQDLLTRGIDEHGNLRSEQTHKFKDSPLGRIPAEWEVLTLASIGTWNSGGTPFKANPNFWGDDIPWVCPKDMKTFDLHSTIENLTHLGLRNGSKLMPAGCVFIVVRGMILAHTFPVCITSCPMSLNQDVKGIVVSPNIEARFFAYWLFDKGQSLLKITTTATHGTKRFDMNELFAVPIAVPSKAEQAQIVKVLDETEFQITTNKTHRAKLHSLKTALMQDLLTGRKRVTNLLDRKETIA